MSSTNVLGGGGRGCVAGLFADDSRADKAMDELKSAGFTGSEVGVATAGMPSSPEHSGFWNKVGNLFGKKEHVEHSETLEGSLIGCGMSEPTAQYFDDAIREGSVLITVVCDGQRAIRAREILARAGADIGDGAAAGASERRRNIPARDTRSIQLRGEVLRAQKERVPTGEVRLRKEVVTEKQHLEVPVEREELVIERTPGGGHQAGTPIGTDAQEIRVPISEERVRVDKKPVVNEEIHVRKQPVQETKRIEDEVRHEELRTEREGNVRVRGDEEAERKKRIA